MSGNDSVAAKVGLLVHGLEYEAIPPRVVAAAKRLILDTLLVARAGIEDSATATLRSLIVNEGGAAESVVWGGTARLPATAATLLNTLAAAALDYDSLHGSVHPDAIALAAAMAVAERQHASGRAFIASYIAGSELVCRLARSTTGAQRGWTLSAIYGVFGAATAAAKLLSLDGGGIAHALGIGLSLASGTQQSNVEQVLTKRLQPSLAARNGVFAALAASAGMSSPAQAFEGRFGLWNLYQAGDANALLAGFGETFVIAETGLKKYPICACSHAAVDAVRALVRSHSIRPEQVVSVIVKISPFMDRLVGGPFRPAENPQVTAQFSLRYAIASILLRDRIGIAEIQEDAVLARDVALVCERVELCVDPSNGGELYPVTVIMRLSSGQSIERTETNLAGGPDAPLSPGELAEKLRECSRWGDTPYGMDRLDALERAVGSIEHVEDMSKFTTEFLAQ